MVRTKKEQEAFEMKLWENEAGEFICIKKGLKYLSGGHNQLYGGRQFLSFDGHIQVRFFRRNLTKALNEFEKAKLLEEKLRNEIGALREYRDTSVQLEKLDTEFIKVLNIIITFIKRINQSYKFNNRELAAMELWDLEPKSWCKNWWKEHPQYKKNEKHPNLRRTPERDRDRPGIKKEEFNQIVNLSEELKERIISLFETKKSG